MPAVRATQARVNQGAKAIIAVSPAEHEPGSKPPGTEIAVETMRQVDQASATRRAELAARMAGRDDEPVPAVSNGPEVA